MAVGQLDADQVAFDEREPGAFENFATLFRMAEQEPHEGALAGVGDRECDDPHLRAVEPTHDLEQLPDPVLEEDRELTQRRPIAAAGGGVTDDATLSLVTNAHVETLRLAGRLCLFEAGKNRV